MNSSRFNIFEVVRNAYVFAGREWLYILRVGLMPMALQAACALFVQFQRPDASQVEAYLWGLPATALFAWFTFVETRLLLLGERVDYLPRDAAFLSGRLHAMKLAVIVSLLFNMGMSAAAGILLNIMESGQWGANLPLTLLGIGLLGGLIWGVRFGLLPLLAAVHYPMRPVLQRVNGFMFSVRLISMGAVCLFPVFFLFQIFLALFLGKPADVSAGLKLTAPEQAALIVIGAPLSLAIATLLNAAALYALKQILGARSNGVLA